MCSTLAHSSVPSILPSPRSHKPLPSSFIRLLEFSSIFCVKAAAKGVPLSQKRARKEGPAVRRRAREMWPQGQRVALAVLPIIVLLWKKVAPIDVPLDLMQVSYWPPMKNDLREHGQDPLSPPFGGVSSSL
ncbi:hypothetical protein MHYP_G00268640 [Metynnis hypsauchen]